MGENSKKSSPASAGRLAVARRFNGGVTEEKNPTALPKAHAQRSKLQNVGEVSCFYHLLNEGI
jgi:hypothetical protein